MFICLSVKAVHLEVVTDLSTKDFFAKFDRFVVRHGLPIKVFSDCETNFVGAAKQLWQLVNIIALQPNSSSLQLRHLVISILTSPKLPILVVYRKLLFALQSDLYFGLWVPIILRLKNSIQFCVISVLRQSYTLDPLLRRQQTLMILSVLRLVIFS